MLRLASALLVVLASSLGPVGAAAEPAPAFTLRLLDSRRVFDSRDALQKKVLVVRFQASWCRPCIREAPALERFHQRYRGLGVEVVAVQVQDTGADAHRFLRGHGATYLAGLDPRLTLANRFGFQGTPFTVVIGRGGELVARIHGESVLRRLPALLASLTQRPGKGPDPGRERRGRRP